MSTSLINTLGGSAGFGENYLERNDDGSTAQIDITSVFPDGLNFFGTVWTSLYINNNGNITFNSRLGQYTPDAITAATSRAIIAAFFADVDTRGTPGGVTPGGTSTGTNLLWYDLDPAAGTITATWDDVGYYGYNVDKLNAFQIQLTRVGDSDFDIAFRYEDINWTTGDASGGEGGLGGTVARAGYSSGDGSNFFELPASGNQDAILDLENSSNTGQTGLWLFQVRNGTPVIALSVGDASIAEGNGPGTTLMNFDVLLSSPTAAPVSVGYFTQAGTAGVADFIGQGGTLTFAPGQIRQTVSVEVIGDRTVEADENFTLRLFDPVNALLADDVATGTIRNDDGVVVDDVSVAEGSGSGTTTASFTVRLLSASAGEVRVDYATAPVTAAAPGDYASASGTLVFAPGETSKTVPVTIVRDSVAEADETFELRLSNPVNTQLADGTAVGTIRNDDGFVVNDFSSIEGTGSYATTLFEFHVDLLSALSATGRVDYAVVGDTATPGADFVANSGTLTFSPGTTRGTVYVEVVRDAVVEPNETFRVVLSNPTGTAIVDGTGVGTIVNDDGVSVGDAFLAEGDSGTSSMTFTVTLSSGSDTPVTVAYATVAGTAAAGSDYTSTSGTVTFAPFDTTETVTVPIVGDTLPEPDETFTLVLSSPVGTGILDGTGVGTIRNDDGLSIANPGNVAEGDSGTRNVSFSVTLNAPSSQTVQVDYATVDGTATAGSDYTAASGRLTFAPGETSKTVAVTVAGDTLYEPNETFRVALSNPVNTRLVDASATATITNDDPQPPPAISVSDVRQTEGSGDGTTAFRFFVSMSRASTSSVSVSYATSPGTAAQGADFAATSGTLTFAAGETLKEVIVPVVRDTAVEADETFTLTLSNPTGGAALGDASGTATIVNDDVTVTIDDASVTEGTGGARSMTFTVRLGGSTPLPLSVDYATADGSATAPGDYQATSGTLTFLPGESQRTVSVPIVTDATREPTETFRLLLSNPFNAVIVDGEAVGTIRNDDPPAVPVITQVADDTGRSGTDLVTRDSTLTLTITGDANATVQVFDGAASLGFATQTGTPGVYAFTTPALADGVHGLVARASDAPDVVSAPSAAVAVTVDTAPPVVTGTTPADGGGVGVAQNVVVRFDQDVDRGSGTIVLRNTAGTALETYDVASNFANLYLYGNTLTVNPTADLVYGNGYRLDFGSGTFRDVAGNPFAGLTTYDFTTDDYSQDDGTTGRVAIGGSSTGRIEYGGDRDWFAVALQAGQRYQFALTGNGLTDPVLSLNNAAGVVLAANDDWGGTLNSRLEYTATASGTYYLGARHYNSSGTGAYTVSALSLTADDYADNASTTGRVAPGGGSSGRIEVAGDVDWFAVTLAAGETYQFRANSTGLGDPRVALYAAGGALLGQDDDSGGGVNARMTFTATTAGTYYVAASGDAGSTGTYNVLAERIVVDDYAGDRTTTGRVNVGSSSTGRIETSGDTDWFAVSLVAGTTYRFTAAGGGSLSDPYLTLYTAGGAEIARDDDGGPGLDSQLDYTAAATGTLYLGARHYSSGTGNYSVGASVLNVDDYLDTTATTGRVTVGGSSTGRIEAVGDRDWFRVTLAAGSTYEFHLTGTGLTDPLLRLYSATGTPIASDDDGGPGYNALLRYTATSAGNYYLGSEGVGGGTGSYSMAAVLIATDDYADNSSTSGRVTVGGSSSGRIEVGGDNDWFAIQLAAGGTYRFAATGIGLSDPYLTLYDGAGTALVRDDDSGPGLDSLITSWTAPASGTYYLGARHFSSGTGNYTVSASQLVVDDYASDAGTTGRVNVGSKVSGNVEQPGDVDWFSVQLTAGSFYRFGLAGNTLSDPILQLLDSSGRVLAANDDANNGTLNSQIDFAARTGGTYYLAASGFGTYRGTYLLTADAFTPPDDYAENATTTGRVTVGTSSSGRIGTVGDRDWFAVDLVQGTRYEFRLDSDGLNDPYLRLYSASGTLLASNDDGGGGLNSMIGYTPAATGRYYLGASDLSSGIGDYTVRATSLSAPADTSYSIRIVYTGDARYQGYFDAAAARWAQVITGDLPDVASATYGSIDDLVIETSVEAIDGPGNILGSAGPRGYRTASDGGLPYIGVMRFDSADLAYMEQRGILGDIVEHEMGHVLGILNGFFAQRGLLGPSGLDFTGANAVAQYRVVAGNGSLASVPLESLGGAGTRGHHWTESIFDEELMTGWAENAPPMPLSVVTVGALADLGYAVNYAAADPFSF